MDEEEKDNVVYLGGEYTTGDILPSRMIEAHKEMLDNEEFEWYVAIGLRKDSDEIIKFSSTADAYKIATAGMLIQMSALEEFKYFPGE